MTRNIQSGLWLAVAGILGVAFFWLTDARYGLARYWEDPKTLIDAANVGFPGTVVGVVASAIVLGIGLWLMTRRTS